MKHKWYVAGDFETHCRFCFNTYRPGSSEEECSYSNNTVAQQTSCYGCGSPDCGIDPEPYE